MATAPLGGAGLAARMAKTGSALTDGETFALPIAARVSPARISTYPCRTEHRPKPGARSSAAAREPPDGTPRRGPRSRGRPVRPGDEFPRFRVAAVQSAPVFLDREATLEKVALRVAEAADNRADLVVFGESFIPGFPVESRPTSDRSACFLSRALPIRDGRAGPADRVAR
jgi:hypothetical protein